MACTSACLKKIAANEHLPCHKADSLAVLRLDYSSAHVACPHCTLA